jgi:hypothetical protein
MASCIIHPGARRALRTALEWNHQDSIPQPKQSPLTLRNPNIKLKTAEVAFAADTRVQRVLILDLSLLTDL